MRIAVTTFLLFAICTSADAQVEWTTFGVPVVESFADYAGNGFDNPKPAGGLSSLVFATTGLQDGACAFGDSCTTGDFARGIGDVESSGGFYAFQVETGNFAFGIQPAGSDFTPGTLTYRITNNAGAVSEVDISFDVWVYNDQNRSSDITASWSIDDVTYTPMPDLDLTTPETESESPVWVKTAKAKTIDLGAPLAAASYFYLRFEFDDNAGAGSRDEVAIDNISTTPYAALAAELTSFATLVTPSGLQLRWTTVSEDQLSGFEVEQTNLLGEFERIGFVAAAGPGSYSFVTNGSDTDARYRLKIVDVDGTFRYSPAVEVESTMSSSFRITDAYPNPFETLASFQVAVEQEQDVNVDLYDILGRHVSTLLSARLGANESRVVLIDGSNLSSGTFFYRVQGERFTQTGQVTVRR